MCVCCKYANFVEIATCVSRAQRCAFSQSPQYISVRQHGDGNTDVSEKFIDKQLNTWCKGEVYTKSSCKSRLKKKNLIQCHCINFFFFKIYHWQFLDCQWYILIDQQIRESATSKSMGLSKKFSLHESWLFISLFMSPKTVRKVNKNIRSCKWFVYANIITTVIRTYPKSYVNIRR